MAASRKSAGGAVESRRKDIDLIQRHARLPTVSESEPKSRTSVEATFDRVDRYDLWPRRAKPSNLDAWWTDPDSDAAAYAAHFSFGQKVQKDSDAKNCQRHPEYNRADDEEAGAL